MIKINLLPQELSVNKGVARMALIIKNLSIVLLVIFIVFGVGIGLFFILSSRQLASLEAEASDLETQIKSQQKVEQSIILLKDRLVKIKTLGSVESAEKVLANMEPVIAALPADATLGELSIDAKEIDMGVGFTSSISLSEFFATLESFDSFSMISLTNFSFNPATGYLVGFSFVTKQS